MIEIKKEINIEELISSKVLESLYVQYKTYFPLKLQKEIYKVICNPDKIENEFYKYDINSLKYFANYEYEIEKGE